jgi:hypothetical protein
MLTEKQRLAYVRAGKGGAVHHVRVLRSGARDRWNKQPTTLEKDAIYADSEKAARSIHLSFSIPAGGQGDTWLEVQIASDDFPTLVALMSAADRDAAMKAMAEELRCQICGEVLP